MSFTPKSHAARTLFGRRVRLEPLELEHLPGLLEFGLDPRIWEWMTHAATCEADLRAYVQSALDERAAGHALPFATIDAATDRVVGTTRFANIAPADLRAEIGWTWLAPSTWRTGINVEAKLLMLQFAFELAGLRRVEFKTDANNARSRAAIEGLGARLEGIHRKHMVRAGGGVRDSAYYSIIDDEWPEVRARLDARLSRG